MALATPQQQAGILSFYDAPEKGPMVDMKFVLVVVALFTMLVLIMVHFANL